MTDPLLLTEKEAADRLLVGPRTLRKLRQAGQIRYVALTGRKIGYRPEDCLAFIESRTKQEAPASTPRHRGRAAGNRSSGNIVPFSVRQGTRG